MGIRSMENINVFDGKVLIRIPVLRVLEAQYIVVDTYTDHNMYSINFVNLNLVPTALKYTVPTVTPGWVLLEHAHKYRC